MNIDWLPPSSRYYGLATSIWIDADGREVPVFPRRILPDPASLALFRTHLVSEGERPDHVAWQELGDAELVWRLVDGNPVLRPEELVARSGRLLRVTLPSSMPASTPALASFNQVLAQQLGGSPAPKGANGG
jgi:hypothetical protein